MFSYRLTAQKMIAQMLLAQLSAMTSIDEFALLEDKQLNRQLLDAGKVINSDDSYNKHLSALIQYINNNY
jgi:hypothetical protein